MRRVPYPLVVLLLAAVFGLGVVIYERERAPDPAREPQRATPARACAAPRVPFTAERPLRVTQEVTVRVPVTVSVERDGEVVRATGASVATVSVTARGVVRARASAAIRECAAAATPEEAEALARRRSEARARRSARRAALRGVRRRAPGELERLRARARTQARSRAAERAASAVAQVRADLRRRAEARLAGG